MGRQVVTGSAGPRAARLVVTAVGVLVGIAGVAILLYGGYLAAITTSEGERPFEAPATVVCLVGVLFISGAIGLGRLAEEWFAVEDRPAQRDAETDRPYRTCPECGKQCRGNRALSQHIEARHSAPSYPDHPDRGRGRLDAAMEPTVARNHDRTYEVCPHCGKRCRGPNALSQHAAAKHS